MAYQAPDSPISQPLRKFSVKNIDLMAQKLYN